MYERLSCWQSRHRAKISRVSRKTQKVTSKRRDGRLYYVQYLYGWASEPNVYTKKKKKENEPDAAALNEIGNSAGGIAL